MLSTRGRDGAHDCGLTLRRAVTWSQRNGLFFALLLMLVGFSLASTHFLTSANIKVILEQGAVTGLIAVPGAMLLMAGYVDLSVGSLAVLAAVAFGEFSHSAGLSLLLSAILAIAIAGAWGCMNGYLICYVGFSPIVVTLGGLAGARGIAEFWSKANTAFGFGQGFDKLGAGSLLGIQNPVWICAVAFLIGAYLWYLAPFGRHMAAIGVDRRVARSVGIDDRRIPFLLYVGSGLAAGLGGLILTAQLDAATLDIGQNVELQVLTAILLGGVSFLGGSGSLFGVLIGVVFISTLNDGLIIVNINPYIKDVAIGAALLFAAGSDVLYRRLESVRIPEPEDDDQPAVAARAAVGVDGTSENLPGAEDEPAVSGKAPVLELKRIVKNYGSVRALRGVDLALRSGEVVGLVGDNGAGKSTLVSIVAGTEVPDEGTIVIDGEERARESPAQARDLGVETVFQTLSLIQNLDIAENIYLNRETFRFGRVGTRLRLMDKAGMRRRAWDGLTELGLRLPSATTKVANLSGGQRQAVAVGRAVFWGSKIVLMDEPTAALGVRQTEIVLTFVERLKRHGIAVLFISHNMQQVLRVCDRIVVLRLGRCVRDAPTAETSSQALVAAITGLDASAV